MILHIPKSAFLIYEVILFVISLGEVSPAKYRVSPGQREERRETREETKRRRDEETKRDERRDEETKTGEEVE